MIPALAAFEGRWRLSRVIEDDIAGRTGRLEGEAVFAPDTHGLTYDEEGTLRFPGQPPLTAVRRYLWRGGGEAVEVLFEDGRAFHRIGPGLTARHPCGEDLYDVAYDFAAWPRWQAVWTVSGPRKSYRMVSTYTR